MGRIASLLALSALCLVASGCSIVAPRYSPSIDNVQTLKNSGIQPAKVGQFATAAGPATASPITLRGHKMRSPYGGSYSTYLSEAITRELSMAGKLSAGADVEITGTLLRNEIDRAIGTGTGDIEARFVVRKASVIRYDQVKRAHREWESSFARGVAIPKAVSEYNYTGQALLGELYADPAFLDGWTVALETLGVAQGRFADNGSGPGAAIESRLRVDLRSLFRA